MEERLANVLRHVVEEYVSTAEAVGSQHLVERYALEVSPATIRNWFAELDETGHLMQPHTSGGRIPTEKGFRFYVETFVRPKPAGKREREQLEKSAVTSADEERKIKNLAKMAAELSGLAVVAGLGEADTFYTGLSPLFGQPEFKDWNRVVTLSEVLDRLDETLIDLRRRSFDHPTILLGRDCPFGSICGSVLATTDMGLIGILGPLRMDYQHAFVLMQTVIDLLKR